MNTEIDLLKFERSSGNLQWLPAAATAFLLQLPRWHIDFDAAMKAQDCTQQNDLLHKMKGACYAVAAYKAADAIAWGETQQGCNKEIFLSGLAGQLALVEAELQMFLLTLLTRQPEH